MSGAPSVLRAWLTASAAHWRKAEAEAREHAERFEETLAIIGAPPRDRYDTVPLADVVREPHVEASITPACDATPTRATMRRPAPPEAHRKGRADKGRWAADGMKARVLAYLAEHGEAGAQAVAAALDAHRPSVDTALSLLCKRGQIAKRRNDAGRGVLYTVAASGDAVSIATVSAGPPGSVKLAASVEDARAGHAVDVTAPPIAPRKINGAEPPAALTGALKIVAKDILRALQHGPMTEMELFQKTAWPFGTIRTVANTLRAERKIAGTEKLRLAGGADE